MGGTAESITERARKPQSAWRYAVALPLGCSCLGFAAALFAHAVAWAGSTPEAFFPDFWILHLALSVLLLPLIVEIVWRKDLSAGMRLPRWARLVLYGLLVYYGLNFYFFLYWSAEHLTGTATWRMMSSGWLLLFAIASFYYLAHLKRSR